ncbi:MAG: hypothetical protein GY853_13155 [PVC group bacterium]|nr:hypothetical protein [PVC group bacterium]
MLGDLFGLTLDKSTVSWYRNRYKDEIKDLAKAWDANWQDEPLAKTRHRLQNLAEIDKTAKANDDLTTRVAVQKAAKDEVKGTVDPRDGSQTNILVVSDADKALIHRLADKIVDAKFAEARGPDEVKVLPDEDKTG